MTVLNSPDLSKFALLTEITETSNIGNSIEQCKSLSQLCKFGLNSGFRTNYEKIHFISFSVSLNSEGRSTVDSIFTSNYRLPIQIYFDLRECDLPY